MSLPRDKTMPAARRTTTCYLNPGELLSHEAASLQHMTAAAWPSPLAWWQRTLYEAAGRAKNQGELHLHVWFEAPAPRAAHGAPQHCIELGAQILPSSGHGLVTYFLAIGACGARQRRGLRKINFDLAPGFNVEEPKPVMHSQISGNMPPSLAQQYDAAGFTHLFPEMEKPRIACLPKSFALLAHLAFLEYHTTHEGIRNLVSDPTWLAVVRESENAILKPHFAYCSDWLGATAHESQSLLNHFYGLPRA